MSTFFGLLTFSGLVAIFDRVTTLGSSTIKGFSITILGVLIIPLVALTLKLFFKDFISLLDALFRVIWPLLGSILWIIHGFVLFIWLLTLLFTIGIGQT